MSKFSDRMAVNGQIPPSERRFQGTETLFATASTAPSSSITVRTTLQIPSLSSLFMDKNFPRLLGKFLSRRLTLSFASESLCKILSFIV